MNSVTTPPSLDAVLEAAVRRYDGASPLTAQIGHHFGYGGTEPPGELLRMRLVLAVAEEERADPADVLDVACAVEVLHQSSLVHDDIEDGDPVRHGRATVWSRFGLAHGINAGDALCAIAYLQLLDRGASRPADVTVLMTHRLQEANYAMCAGLASDIAFERAADVSLDEYLAMVDGKTSALFGAACELGALAAGAEPERARAYARLGRTYGLAFQIDDDVRSARKWTYPAIARRCGAPPPAVATRAYLAQADAIAAHSGIDRAGSVRGFFGRHIPQA